MNIKKFKTSNAFIYFHYVLMMMVTKKRRLKRTFESIAKKCGFNFGNVDMKNLICDHDNMSTVYPQLLSKSLFIGYYK